MPVELPCSVWLSQAAGVKHPLSGLYPQRSWCGAARAARTASPSLEGPSSGERVWKGLQSTPPAHTIQSRSISALAWRRAPRAIPDLNVLFVRLALGRSSPSASAWRALTPGTAAARGGSTRLLAAPACQGEHPVCVRSKARRGHAQHAIPPKHTQR